MTVKHQPPSTRSLLTHHRPATSSVQHTLAPGLADNTHFSVSLSKMEPLMLLQGDPLSPLTPLILVHAISGIALPYLGLNPLSRDGRPVYGVTSPAYTDRSYRLPCTLGAAAHQYLGLIRREVQATGPYLLGGWSMGGVIALNMARILRQQHETVLHVLMIDSGCPAIYPPFRDRAEHDAIASLLFAAVTKGRATSPPPPPPSCALLASGSTTPSSDDDEEDGIASDQIFARMRKHIHNGLSMIGRADDNECLRHGYDSAVTLIKCSSLAPPSSVLSDARKAAVQRCFRDEQMGWNQDGRFADFRTVRVDSQHDRAFDRLHVGHLSRVIGDILLDIE